MNHKQGELTYPFHLAFPVSDLEKTKWFYGDVLQCEIGRSSTRWVDFNFFGHQLSAHLRPEEINDSYTNPVDGHNVPVRHFGVILDVDKWNILKKRLEDLKISFIIEPYTRFKGKPGEQSTLFIKDPSGNALEFKAFRNWDMIFEK
jgi:extradiol dioxygenase family protein